jgi:transcriptional regulator with XRE-family HTH domain
MENTESNPRSEHLLGEQLRDLRLRQNLDQRELAARAGVALNAVKRLESGRGSTVRSLVRVLRALGRADWLQSLAPPVSVSPLQLLESRGARRRASRRRSA